MEPAHGPAPVPSPEPSLDAAAALQPPSEKQLAFVLPLLRQYIYICENILDDDIVRECGERPNSRDGIKHMKTHYSFNNGDNERTMTEWTYYHYRDWLSFIGMV